jgi:hypothetical protein
MGKRTGYAPLWMLFAALWLAVAPRAESGGSEPDTDDVGFVSFGLGTASDGPAGIVSLNFSRGDLFYGARLTTSEEFELFGPDPHQSDKDVAVLVGACFRGRMSFVSAATGLGFVESVRRGRLLSDGEWLAGGDRYERIDRSGVAVPIDLKAMFHGRHWGLGLNIFAAMGHRGFTGVALVVQAGRLGVP